MLGFSFRGEISSKKSAPCAHSSHQLRRKTKWSAAPTRAVNKVSCRGFLKAPPIVVISVAAMVSSPWRGLLFLFYSSNSSSTSFFDVPQHGGRRGGRVIGADYAVIDGMATTGGTGRNLKLSYEMVTLSVIRTSIPETFPKNLRFDLLFFLALLHARQGMKHGWVPF